MALPRVQYTGKDFDTFFAEIVNEVQTNFGDAANDFTESNLGTMFIDLVSFALDTMSFYQDFQAGETFMPTAVLDGSVAKIARQLGFKATGAVPASTELTFTLPAALANNLPIQEDTQFVGTDGFIWEAVQKVTLLAAQTEIKFTVREGETVEERFISDGSKNQSFQIGQLAADKKMAEADIEVFVDNEQWETVDFLEFRNDKIVEVQPRFDPPEVFFGDNISGQIPPNGAEIVVRYFATSGVLGNDAEAGSITSSRFPIVLNGNSVTFSVTNVNKPTGGSDGRTTEEVRRLAPEVFRSQDAAVTTRDIIALSESFTDISFGEVAKASAISVRSAAADQTLNTLLLDLSAIIGANDDSTDLATLSTIKDFFAGTERTTILDALTEIESQIQLQSDDLETLAGYEDPINDDLVAVNNAADFVAPVFNQINIINTIADENLTNIENDTVQQQIGTGTTGSSDSFAALLTIPDDSRVVPSSITVRRNGTGLPGSGTAVAVDTGVGTISGSGLNGTINYITGAITVNETANVFDGGESVDVDYRTYDPVQAEVLSATSSIGAVVRAGQTNIESAISALEGQINALLIVVGDLEERGTGTIQEQIDLIRTELATLPASYFADFDTALTNISTRETTVNSDLSTLSADIFNYVDGILSSDCQANVVEVAILTLDSNGFYQGASAGLVNALQDYLDERKEATVVIRVISGESLLLGVSMNVQIAVSQALIVEDVRLAVEEVIDDLLKGKDYGEDLRLSDVYETVTAVSGVQYAYVTITQPSTYVIPQGDVVIPDNFILTKGTVNVTILGA